jgi:hypothetical protein
MPDLTDVQAYAIDLVAEGAEGVAEDDLDENGVLNDDDKLGEAIDLACTMARTIGSNPAAFLAWYDSIRTNPKE